ncbi:MAG: metallophosphoesterase family protein [Gemmatimonadaceae bacterium]
MPLHIGLISDTHGLLRPQVHTALQGVELILHAGDVGGEEILAELALIAPVRAVAGNCDDPRSAGLTLSLDFDVDGVSVHVSHGHELGVPKPAALFDTYAADVIVYGHTHRPLVARRGERLVVNPGAAGPRRFDLRPSVARLTLSPTSRDVDIVAIDT